MFLKLDGNTIISHDYYQHDEYQTSVADNDLVETHPIYGVVYKYKYVDGELVELTEEEKAVHPVMINNWKQSFNAERFKRISDVEWMLTSHSNASENCQAEVLTYINSLRDLPDAEGFKYYAPVWPEAPQYEKA